MKMGVKLTAKNRDALKKLAQSVSAKVTAQVGVIRDPEVATYAAYTEFGWVQQV